MDKTFYRNLLAITMPIAFQNIISYSVNMMDTLMLGSLGETVLSASSLAGQVFFLFSILVSGLGCGAGVLCSQYFGKRDLKNLRKIAAMVLKLAIGLSVIFTLILLICPAAVMKIFTPEAAVIEQGAKYLRVVAVSYICFGITTTFLIVLRSLQDVKLSLWIYTVSFFTNVFFNYVFIFGHFGFPRMGIVGAALGTVMARGVEVALVIIYLRKYEKVLKFKPIMLKLYDRILFKDMIKYGLPVIVGELFWGIGLSAHSAILGHMGEAVVAANSICNVLHQFALSFVQGVGSASAVIMGRYIGAGEFDMAKKASKALVKFFAVCGVITAVFLLSVSGPFFSFYSLQPATLKLAKHFMLAYAFITMFRAVSAPIIGGILWGSGDTRFAATVDISFLWCLLPIGFMAAFKWHWNPALVLVILRLETPLKMVACLIRLRGDKWIKSTVR